MLWRKKDNFLLSLLECSSNKLEDCEPSLPEMLPRVFCHPEVKFGGGLVGSGWGWCKVNFVI